MRRAYFFSKITTELHLNISDDSVAVSNVRLFVMKFIGLTNVSGYLVVVLPILEVQMKYFQLNSSILHISFVQSGQHLMGRQNILPPHRILHVWMEQITIMNFPIGMLWFKI